MNCEFKGTPGPWKAFYMADGGCGVSAPRPTGGTSDIAQCGRLDTARNVSEENANACAIAELPELIDAGNAALESLLFSRQELLAQASIPDADEQQIQDAIDALRQALTKATGGDDG